MPRPKPTIGITLGDPAGIGAEVVAKALNKPAIRNLAEFKLIGDMSVYRRYSKARIFPGCEFVDLKSLSAKSLRPGHPTALSSAASLTYIEKAIALLKEKEITALVTAPVYKEGITSLGKIFHGHTEFLAEAFGVHNFDMMFVTKTLKTVIVTRHLALKDVGQALSTGKIYQTIDLAHQALRKYFKIQRPRIAVCGINPHAGEGGTIGQEEITIISPAIENAKAKGFRVAGPLAADTLFTPLVAKDYDVIIAMYHDQGLIPVKTLYFRNVVNLTIGLPFIRTSPAHGTAFNIAGKNTADPSSMMEAIRLAAALRCA